MISTDTDELYDSSSVKGTDFTVPWGKLCKLHKEKLLPGQGIKHPLHLTALKLIKHQIQEG